jgi:putative transposase
MAKIKRVYEASKGVYGSPRVHAELVGESVHVGRHKVARLMRMERLRGCPKRRFRVTMQRDPAHPVAKNLLQQDFTAEAPNQRWAADITYISTAQGWLYLAVVMDLYSRRIVGWSMSRWMSRHLVVDALRMALDDFRDELAKHGIECSMSGSANCYDNAVVESFFGLLERERVNRVRYRTRDEARAELFEYIEVFYNRKRRHGYLGNLSPADFEERSAGSFETVH